MVGAMERIESCNSLWLFEPDRREFCRLPRGADPSAAVGAVWRQYFSLYEEPASGAFHVALDPDRTRWLASWRHVDPCPHCGDHPTSEMVLPGPVDQPTDVAADR